MNEPQNRQAPQFRRPNEFDMSIIQQILDGQGQPGAFGYREHKILIEYDIRVHSGA